MANVIKPKRTSVAGKVPTTTDLQAGEIALNMADSILYFRDTSDNIKSVSSGLATVGTAGTYTKVTTDVFGRVTAGTTLISSDLPTYTGTITSSQVTTALGFTPYNSTNPSGYTANTGTVTSVSTSGAITGGTITTTGTISHSTADGYLHIPATGTTNNGKVLTAGATAGSVSWVTPTTGTVTSVAMSTPTGLTVTGSPITSSGTLALTLTSGYSIPTTSSQTNWDTAYTDRNKWDGGSAGLTASTGRTSLGATTIGSNLFTLTNPSAITFPRFNADNTVSSLDAATFRTAIGAGTSSTTGTVTSIATSGAITGGTITSTGTISHSTSDGYLHVPATSTTNNGKVLTAGATAGSLSWTTPTTGTVTSVVGGSYLTGGTITTSGTLAVDATSANTASKVVARDTSGNFSAGTITASLSGNATTATTATTATKLGSTTIGSSTLPMYLNAGTATACSTTLGVSITGSSASCTGNAATATNVAWSGVTSKPTTLSGYGITDAQATLVSGTNIKTVNSTSLLGSGNIAVQATLVSGTNIKTVNSTSLLGSGDVAVQPTLVSGTNIKTVNGSSLMGSGDMPIYTGFKNYIINGKKAVNQRGLTSTDNNYNQDRWYKAGDNWYQGIEGDSNLISGKTYTLSWTGSATAGYYVGTATSTTINSQTFTSIANGGSFTLTISAGQNLWIKFVSDANGSTFNFVQLEEGSVKTPFEQRPYSTELALCQRYYERGFFDLESGGRTDFMPCYAQYKVVKRANPTLTVYSVGTSNAINKIYNLDSSTDVSITSVSTSGGIYCLSNIVGTFSPGGHYGAMFTASAEL